MEIAKRILIIGVLLTLFEVLCYLMVIEWADRTYPYSWVGVGWGIYRHISFWFFVYGISIINLSIALTKRVFITIPIALVIIGYYIYDFHSASDIRPYRVLMRELLISGFAAFSFVVSYFYQRKVEATPSTDGSIKDQSE